MYIFILNNCEDYFLHIPSDSMWTKDPFSVELRKKEFFKVNKQDVNNLIKNFVQHRSEKNLNRTTN